MAKVFIEETTLTAIGDAIREKTGKTELIDPALMSTEIASIEAGGGGDLPEEAFNISGSCAFRFRENSWNWFIEGYGNKITTEGITSLEEGFRFSSNLKRIPFTLNITNCTKLNYAFYGMTGLEETPRIRGTLSAPEAQSLLDSCYLLRDIEDLFDPEMWNCFSEYVRTSKYGGYYLPTLYNLYSLREVPSWWYKFRLNENSTSYVSTSWGIYGNIGSECFALNKVVNIPVWRCKAAQTENMFGNSFHSSSMLEHVTFETNNGQPIVTQWKNQTINLGQEVGYIEAHRTGNILNYNSGVTTATKVSDDASYQALKNVPDWWASSLNYSKYNHDSAVETINSLPDTSAYLATAGGTNTILFYGRAGSKTDGGAINTLTAEEIAVATAKGWTVTLA